MRQHGIQSLDDLSAKSTDELEWYWESVSRDIGIVWSSPYRRVLDSSKGIMWSKWFVGGKTNIYSSSVEKFAKETPSKIAYHFVSEDETASSITYAELDQKVSRLANGLKSLGVKRGDVVAIYMPMIEETILTILAASKIGAVQTVIFSGYGTKSLHVRLRDCGAKVLFVTDGFHRKGKPVSQIETVKKALDGTTVEKTIVVSYKNVDIYETSDNVTTCGKLVSSCSSHCPTEAMDSEDPLFVLYTSGTTGRPKGVVHVHGGFSVFAGHQAAYLIDMHADDVLFWPADIGWITGLVWNVYGLLLMGASSVIYDGALDHPGPDRVWKILSDYQATIFGVSPTATRMLKRNDGEPHKGYSLGKIRNIPTTGEPLDEGSWWWLFEKIGNKKIPIMNLSGGTEIGGAMLSVFPGMRLKPSTVGIPVPGMNLDIVDDSQMPVRNKNGYLIIRSPWPGMTRSLLNDDEGFIKTYWSRFENVWFHGDYVCVDEDNLWYMRGRADDVVNVSGHRMSATEIEHAVISHPRISDAASIAIPDDITGEAVAVFFVPCGRSPDAGLVQEVSDYVSEKIGKVARPKFVFQLSDLPRTRTGKILRRLLKSRLLGTDLGDVSSLENPHVLDEFSPLEMP